VNLSAAFGGIGRALRNAVATVGRWLYRMAVGWLTWELTHSTGWLGIIAFADTFPTVVLSLLAGAIADRVGYFRVVRISQFLTAGVAGLFAGLALAGDITIELVLVLTILHGSLEALSTPARMAAVHSLVPRADLSAAIALQSTTFNGARIIGPAIAGVLIVWLGSGAVMAAATLTYVVFFVVLLGIDIDETERSQKVSLDIVEDIAKSLRYAFGNPGIRFVMIILAAGGRLVRPYIDLLPGFAAQVFAGGAQAFAILLSSIGVGATAAGLWLAQRGETSGLTRIVTLHLLVMSAALVAFTLLDHLWLAAAALVVCGFWMLTGSVGCQTLVQNATESAVRARVMSLFILISWGLPALGALAMGWLASFFGLRATIGAGAALALALWLWARREAGGLAPALERGA
jgi:MFS family permease